jgi:hypothetical protein
MNLPPALSFAELAGWLELSRKACQTRASPQTGRKFLSPAEAFHARCPVTRRPAVHVAGRARVQHAAAKLTPATSMAFPRALRAKRVTSPITA